MSRTKFLHLAKEANEQGTTAIPGKISTADMAPASEPADIKTTPAESSTVLVGEGPVEMPEEGDSSAGVVAVGLDEHAKEHMAANIALVARLRAVSKTLEKFTPDTFSAADAELLHLAIGPQQAKRLLPSVESFTPETNAVMLRFAKEEVSAALLAVEAATNTNKQGFVNSVLNKFKGWFSSAPAQPAEFDPAATAEKLKTLQGKLERVKINEWPADAAGFVSREPAVPVSFISTDANFMRMAATFGHQRISLEALLSDLQQSFDALEKLVAAGVLLDKAYAKGDADLFKLKATFKLGAYTFSKNDYDFAEDYRPSRFNYVEILVPEPQSAADAAAMIAKVKEKNHDVYKKASSFISEIRYNYAEGGLTDEEVEAAGEYGDLQYNLTSVFDTILIIGMQIEKAIAQLAEGSKQVYAALGE